jgi:DtxR family Mn-dependent transcriptional regulator
LETSPRKQLSSAVEDYLKAIYALDAAGERVTTSAIAERMRVSAPSATAMMKRLAELDLVERAPYRGVVLTDRGRLCALEVLRHHRLLERYLADSLGMALDEVHAEADRLEHVLSERLEARIDAALGFPTHDPHGDPIPDRELRIADPVSHSLADLGLGDCAFVTRVPDVDADLLRYLGEIALVPGEPLELTRVAPFGGPLTVRTTSGEHAIALELAAMVGVSRPLASGAPVPSVEARGGG